MSIGSFSNPTYSGNRPRESPHVDCRAMLPLEVHLANLATLLETCPAREQFRSTPDATAEWQRAGQWLKAAAGLSWVDLDMYGDSVGREMCGTVWEYESAQNLVKSHFVTEQTRLQYVWNTTERLMKVLHPGRGKHASPRYAEAAESLDEAWADRELPGHFSCVVRHLRAHLIRDPAYAHDNALAAPLADPAAGSLLLCANRMRHIPAHGDVVLPEAQDWGDRIDPTDHLRLLHAPRLGSRALALSIQMLLNPEPSGTDLLLSAHLWGSPDLEDEYGDPT